MSHPRDTGRIIQSVLILMYALEAASEGIWCYKCYASGPQYERDPPSCSQFEEHERLQVYCNLSTFCVKKTIFHTTQTGVTTTVTRDCARQKLTSKIYRNGEWLDKVEVVDTAYEAGCTTDKERGQDAPEYCYCRHDLCNSTTGISNTYSVLLATMLPVLTFLLAS